MQKCDAGLARTSHRAYSRQNLKSALLARRWVNVEKMEGLDITLRVDRYGPIQNPPRTLDQPMRKSADQAFAGPRAQCVGKSRLLGVDRTASAFDLFLDLCNFFFRSAFLESRWAAFDHLLGFHKRSASDRFDNLDHVQLLVAKASEDNIPLCLALFPPLLQ